MLYLPQLELNKLRQHQSALNEKLIRLFFLKKKKKKKLVQQQSKSQV
jgi:hypothetical protein